MRITIILVRIANFLSVFSMYHSEAFPRRGRGCLGLARDSQMAPAATSSHAPDPALHGEIVVHALQPAFDLLEEAGRGKTVEGAMVEAEREVHHRPDRNHVADDH